MDWHTSKLIRIENGSVGISVNDARVALSLYRVDHATGMELLKAARQSRRPLWTNRYKKFGGRREFLFLCGLEAEADEILQHHPSVVPGLLQIQEYAEALYRGSPDDPQPVPVAIHAERRRRVFDPNRVVRYRAVIEESALHRPTGGPRVMRKQLKWVLECAARPEIDIFILPTDATVHVEQAIEIVRLADDVDPDEVYLGVADGSFVDTADGVARYSQLFDRLVRAARHGPDAISMIQKAIDTL
jgi:hypothetical protein